jgi:hypothetical protein
MHRPYMGPILPISWVPGAVTPRWSGQGLKLTTYRHLAQRWKSGARNPPPGLHRVYTDGFTAPLRFKQPFVRKRSYGLTFLSSLRRVCCERNKFNRIVKYIFVKDLLPILCVDNGLLFWRYWLCYHCIIAVLSLCTLSERTKSYFQYITKQTHKVK